MTDFTKCKEAYSFLAELITKMNDQPNAGTATPYYYTIRTMVKEWGIGPGFEDDFEWVKDGDEFGDDAEFAEYAKERIIEELQSGGGTFVELAESDGIDIEAASADEALECELEINFSCVDTFGDYNKVYWRNAEELKGVFLTKEACELHLQQNRHHYSKDSHPYVLHFFRNPEMKKLFESVGEIIGVPYERK